MVIDYLTDVHYSESENREGLASEVLAHNRERFTRITGTRQVMEQAIYDMHSRGELESDNEDRWVLNRSIIDANRTMTPSALAEAARNTQALGEASASRNTRAIRTLTTATRLESQILDYIREINATEGGLATTDDIVIEHFDATSHEIETALEALEERNVIHIDEEGDGGWVTNPTTRSRTITPPQSQTSRIANAIAEQAMRTQTRTHEATKAEIRNAILLAMAERAGRTRHNATTLTDLTIALEHNPIFLNPSDQRRYGSTSELTWRYRMRWGLIELRERGMIRKTSRRSEYELTGLGIGEAEEASRREPSTTPATPQAPARRRIARTGARASLSRAYDQYLSRREQERTGRPPRSERQDARTAARDTTQPLVEQIGILGEVTSDTEAAFRFGGSPGNHTLPQIIAAIQANGANIITTNLHTGSLGQQQAQRLRRIARETGYDTAAANGVYILRRNVTPQPATQMPTVALRDRVRYIGIMGTVDGGLAIYAPHAVSAGVGEAITRTATEAQIISAIQVGGLPNIETNLSNRSPTTDLARMRRIARATGYNTDLRDNRAGIGTYWLVRGTTPQPQAATLPTRFTRPMTPRQAQQLVLEQMAVIARGEEGRRFNVSGLAHSIYRSTATNGRMVAEDITPSPQGRTPRAELKLRRAIRKLQEAGRIEQGVITIRRQIEQQVGTNHRFIITNPTRTQASFGEQPSFRITQGYRIREGFDGLTYNTLTGFPQEAWMPRTGDLFYNPERRRVFEFIRRISTSQPDGMGVPMPEGIAEVKDLQANITGEADFLKIRRSIPVQRISGLAQPAEAPVVEAMPEARPRLTPEGREGRQLEAGGIDIGEGVG